MGVTPDAPSAQEPSVAKLAGPSLFVRNATGLVREVGLGQAFVINMSVLNPAVGLVTIAVALAIFPGTDMTWPFVIAAVLVLFLALSYAQLVSSMPRTGGDFVFISRVIHPAVGAMAGGALLLTFMLVGGTNTTIFSQQYLPFGFQALGKAFNASGLSSFGTDLTNKTPAFIVSLILIVLLLAVSLYSTRLLNRIMFWCIILATVGYVVVVIEFLINSRAAFVTAFNHYSANPGAYSGIIHTAEKLGAPSHVQTAAVIAAIPFAALAYWGFTWSVYPSGEVKRPMRTTKISTLLALAGGIVMYLVGWLALKHATGLSFLQGANWLQANNPTDYGHLTAAPTTITFYALLLSTDPVSKILMAVAFPAATIAIIAAYILVLSRIAFALSFDRLLPTFMSDVTAKRRVPRNAYILSALGFVVFVALAIYSSFLSVFRDLTLLGAIGFALVSLAATLLPWRKRDLYEASPRAFKGKWLGLPPIAVIGGISTIVNVWMAYEVIAKPQILGGYSLGSIITLIVVFGWGLVAYAVALLWTRSRGLGFGLATRELPPE
jgi:basic amino acid/polyamine antiporter, APA family